MGKRLEKGECRQKKTLVDVFVFRHSLLWSSFTCEVHTGPSCPCQISNQSQ